MVQNFTIWWANWWFKSKKIILILYNFFFFLFFLQNCFALNIDFFFKKNTIKCYFIEKYLVKHLFSEKLRFVWDEHLDCVVESKSSCFIKRRISIWKASQELFDSFLEHKFFVEGIFFFFFFFQHFGHKTDSFLY